MSFNRKFWLDWKTRKPCPTCNVGILLPPSKEGFLKSETIASREMMYGVSMSEYVFSIHLVCNHCKDIVAASGYMTEQEDIEEVGGIYTTIQPITFFPAPKIIDIPPSCPKTVTKKLNESFGLYWIDISSCANKIRISIETLLNELNVITTKKTKKGIQTLTLHKRIEEFEKQKPEVAGFLLSIKWIGNAGSHLSEVTKNDVLNAYELLEYSLDSLYDDRKRKLKELSDKINAAKGPTTEPPTKPW